MNKERKICGVKVFVSGETYNEYKGTLEEQLEEKNKEIERLNNIINELEKYINKEFYVVANSPKGSFYEGYDTCLIEMKQEILDKLKELKGE